MTTRGAEESTTRIDRRRLLAALVTGAGITLAVRPLERSSRAAIGTPTPCLATPTASPLPATPAATSAEPVLISMRDTLTFEPSSITIPLGTTVRWINESVIPHTATGDPEQNPLPETRADLIALPAGAEPWGSDLLQSGDAYEHQFDTPGRYDYICIPHLLSNMHGSIIVTCADPG